MTEKNLAATLASMTEAEREEWSRRQPEKPQGLAAMLAEQIGNDSVRKHEPLNSGPTLLSEEKRAWCALAWPKKLPLKQPNIAVFHYVMQSTPCPSAPDETMAFSYMRKNKLHDKEPEAILKAINEIDPNWFDLYPRKATTVLDDEFKKNVVISELARTFYHYGLPAYGKPKLRKQNETLAQDEPLAAL